MYKLGRFLHIYYLGLSHFCSELNMPSGRTRHLFVLTKTYRTVPTMWAVLWPLSWLQHSSAWNWWWQSISCSRISGFFFNFYFGISTFFFCKAALCFWRAWLLEYYWKNNQRGYENFNIRGVSQLLKSTAMLECQIFALFLLHRFGILPECSIRRIDRSYVIITFQYKFAWRKFTASTKYLEKFNKR